MQTLEAVREKIKANMPKADAPRDETLRWARESGSTLITTCARFRISRQVENGTTTYWAWTVASEGHAPRGIGGRFMELADAKDACQFLA